MRARHYCRCGASLTLTGPESLVLPVVKTWREEHRGQGHGVCDAKAAAKARSGEMVKVMRVEPPELVADDF